MKTEYYRIVIDFALTEEEATDQEKMTDLFVEVTDAVVGVLEEPHGEDEPCSREFFIGGSVVTDEVEEELKSYADEEVAALKAQLNETGSVEDFLKPT